MTVNSHSSSTLFPTLNSILLQQEKSENSTFTLTENQVFESKLNDQENTLNQFISKFIEIISNHHSTTDPGHSHTDADHSHTDADHYYSLNTLCHDILTNTHITEFASNMDLDIHSQFDFTFSNQNITLDPISLVLQDPEPPAENLGGMEWQIYLQMNQLLYAIYKNISLDILLKGRTKSTIQGKSLNDASKSTMKGKSLNDDSKSTIQGKSLDDGSKSTTKTLKSINFNKIAPSIIEKSLEYLIKGIKCFSSCHTNGDQHSEWLRSDLWLLAKLLFVYMFNKTKESKDLAVLSPNDVLFVCFKFLDSNQPNSCLQVLDFWALDILDILIHTLYYIGAHEECIQWFFYFSHQLIITLK